MVFEDRLLIICIYFTRVEIQATVKAPTVRNMRKAISLYYIFAMSLWIILTYVGYWCESPPALYYAPKAWMGYGPGANTLKMKLSALTINAALSSRGMLLGGDCVQ